MSLTPEQALQRRGMLTASKAPVIMGDLNTKGLSEYTRRLAGERLFGDLGEESYQNAAMARGSELEEQAISWFEFMSDTVVERQVFVRHPSIPTVSSLLDGLLRDVHTLEAKCPLFHTWAETREAWKRGQRGLGAIPSEYRWQCRWHVWCAGVPEGRYVSYHPTGGGQGDVIPYEVEQSDFDRMAERVVVVEGLIRNWMDILRPEAA